MKVKQYYQSINLNDKATAINFNEQEYFSLLIVLKNKNKKAITHN